MTSAGSPKLVLASSSPRRKQLLQRLGLNFLIDPSLQEENFNPRTSSPEIAVELSRQKAENVAGRYRDAVILAADTIVVCQGEIMGKPQSLSVARDMLVRLRKQEHKVYTGLAVLGKSQGNNGELLTELDCTRVKMRNFSDAELEAYLESGEPMGKAGAYAIQGLGSLLVESITGSYFTVMGLPVHLLPDMLGKFAIRIL